MLKRSRNFRVETVSTSDVGLPVLFFQADDVFECIRKAEGYYLQTRSWPPEKYRIVKMEDRGEQWI